MIGEKCTELIVILTHQMKFLKNLTKDGWTIYIYILPDQSYIIEYSDDGFGSKVRKSYDAKSELLDMLSKRFSVEELDWLD